jgi:hypothetical protein
MAYYDALVAKWAQAPAGTTQQKLDWVNAQVVVGAALPMKVPYTEIYNRLDRTQYNALSATNQSSVQRILAQQTIDFGPSSEARRQMYALFPSGTSRTNLANYAATFDTPQVPWPTATLAQGGGGLNAMVAMSDLKAAGII